MLLDLAPKSKLIFYLYVRCRYSFVLGFLSKAPLACSLTLRENNLLHVKGLR